MSGPAYASTKSDLEQRMSVPDVAHVSNRQPVSKAESSLDRSVEHEELAMADSLFSSCFGWGEGAEREREQADK